MGRAHTGSNSTQEIGTRKRGSTISTGCSTMISLMSLSTVSSMDYRLDLVQKPICLTCFIGRIEPAFLEKKKSILPILGGFLTSACPPSGDRMNTIALHVTG